jgi:hypothetical protein
LRNSLSDARPLPQLQHALRRRNAATPLIATSACSELTRRDGAGQALRQDHRETGAVDCAGVADAEGLDP